MIGVVDVVAVRDRLQRAAQSIGPAGPGTAVLILHLEQFGVVTIEQQQLLAVVVERSGELPGDRQAGAVTGLKRRAVVDDQDARTRCERRKRNVREIKLHPFRKADVCQIENLRTGVLQFDELE